VFNRKTENSEQPWYGDGVSFSCTQCGNCCTGPSGYVWFDDDEAQAMAEHLGIDTMTFLREYASKALGRWTLAEVRRGKLYDCIFLKENQEGKRFCSIYPVRPTQCRTWPFWPSNMKSRKAWDAAAESCPGMRNPDTFGPNFVPVDQIRITMQRNPDHL